MDIKLSYLYRDAGNHKNFGEVVFENPENTPLDKIEKIVRSSLIEQQWFIAKTWALPDLHFEKWDEERDHGWHEFEKIDLTSEPPNVEMEIKDFLVMIQQ